VALSVDTSDLPRVDRSVPRPWHTWYVPTAVVLDTAAGAAGATTALIARFGYARTPAYVALTLALPIAWLLVMALQRNYERRYLGDGVEEFRRIIRAGVTLMATVAFVAYFTQTELARGYVLLALPLTVGATLTGRYLLRKGLHRARKAGRAMQRVLVVGQPDSVDELVRTLALTPYHGLQVVGVCLPPGSNRDDMLDRGIPVIEGFDRADRAVEITGADTVAIVCSSELTGAPLRRLAWSLERLNVDLFVAPGLVEIIGPRLSIRPADGLPLLHVEPPRFTGFGRMVKMVMDRALAGLALFVLAPAFLLIAAAVRLTSTGPALFRQRRVGEGGRHFTVFKFRTMSVDAEQRLQEMAGLNEHEGGVLFKVRRDPRVTRVGAVLRRYSMDELPQLINVLKGQMSLVGPRPPLPEEVERYPGEAHRRLLVKPGLTGLWQISGRSDLSWEESVRLDLHYVENWSLALDLVILWKTAFAVLSRKGAY
jgi:exopolysaccharide biosynthesis polyprenyl glycosylphosphotransferase